MIGLLLKDFYTMRQYGKTMIFMLILFSVISAGQDNPAVFFEGFFMMIAMTMAITSFGYDTVAKWDRYALSLPVTRAEVVASKYLLSLILCFGGAVISFLVSAAILRFKPVEDFSMTMHLYVTAGLIGVVLFLSGIMLPLTFKFGTEKSRIILVGIFALPTAAIIAIGKMGIPMIPETTLIAIAKLLPFFLILFYLLSYYLSVKIFSAKEI